MSGSALGSLALGRAQLGESSAQASPAATSRRAGGVLGVSRLAACVLGRPRSRRVAVLTERPGWLVGELGLVPLTLSVAAVGGQRSDVVREGGLVRLVLSDDVSVPPVEKALTLTALLHGPKPSLSARTPRAAAAGVRGHVSVPVADGETGWLGVQVRVTWPDGVATFPGAPVWLLVA